MNKPVRKPLTFVTSVLYIWWIWHFNGHKIRNSRRYALFFFLAVSQGLQNKCPVLFNGISGLPKVLGDQGVKFRANFQQAGIGQVIELIGIGISLFQKGFQVII